MEALKTRLDGILTYATPVQRFNQLSQQANWQLVIKLVRYIPKATCNNSQNCWANNFGSYCVRFGSGVQTDATTPKNIGTYNASWKRYHPYDFGDSSCAMPLRGPNNVGRTVQTDPTLLCHASATTEQKKCWELLAQKFDRFQLAQYVRLHGALTRK